MGLSSNILWHQTNYQNLRKILKQKKILCSYSMEDLSFVLGTKMAFPMISMCDLPFSEMLNYIGKYGDYSLGLSREWGLRNKFNHIWYCDPRSMAAEAFKEYLKSIRKNHDANGVYFMMNILSYVKTVEGKLLKRGYQSYKFCDEREVRFVPSSLITLKNKYDPILKESDYERYKQDHAGSSVVNFGVDFNWTDVKYLVVKEDKQIQTFRNLLSILGCPTDAVHIFSTSQVKEDFVGSDHNVTISTYELNEKDIQDIIRTMVKGINNR